MKNYSYPSPICEYCYCTGQGLYVVNTNFRDSCEGVGCSEAFEAYKEEGGEAETIEETF